MHWTGRSTKAVTSTSLRRGWGVVCTPLARRTLPAPTSGRAEPPDPLHPPCRVTTGESAPALFISLRWIQRRLGEPLPNNCVPALSRKATLRAPSVLRLLWGRSQSEGVCVKGRERKNPPCWGEDTETNHRAGFLPAV